MSSGPTNDEEKSVWAAAYNAALSALAGRAGPVETSSGCAEHADAALEQYRKATSS